MPGSFLRAGHFIFWVMWTISVSVAAVTKCQRWGGWSNRSALSHSPGG